MFLGSPFKPNGILAQETNCRAPETNAPYRQSHRGRRSKPSLDRFPCFGTDLLASCIIAFIRKEPGCLNGPAMHRAHVIRLYGALKSNGLSLISAVI